MHQRSMSPEERIKEAVPEHPKFEFTPTYEEYAAWCRHPVTGFVALAMLNLSESFKREWLVCSWGDGAPDPLMLARFKAYSDAYLSFTQSKRDDYVRAIEA